MQNELETCQLSKKAESDVCFYGPSKTNPFFHSDFQNMKLKSETFSFHQPSTINMDDFALARENTNTQISCDSLIELFLYDV